MNDALIHAIASAIVRLSRRRAPGDPAYEDGVQQAYNQLVLYCLQHGEEPPASVPDLVRRVAGTPLGEAGYLVDAATCTPTQTCLEWARDAANVQAELFENAVIEEALATCRSARAPESYTAFRRLLISKPVLTAAELAALAGDIDLVPVLETVRKCYEPAPAAYRRDGAYQACGRCGCLLVPLSTGGYRCELDRCRADRAAVPVQEVPANLGVQQLRRPLRVFITSPGIAEIDLEARLRKLGLVPQMWPGFDAYDLRVLFPGGPVWAVDVKDWANPALLGKSITAGLRADPPYDKAFIVIPEYRFKVREDYARVVRHHLADDLCDRIEVCSDTAFIRQARREARREDAHA